MARIRSVKPEFFTSETIAALSVPARLTFVGLWTFADDYGRALDNPKLLKAAVWPLDDDVSASAVEGHLGEFVRARLVCRYQVTGKRYLHIPSWPEHQKPKNPAAERIPACPKQSHGGDDPGDALPHEDPSPTPVLPQDGDRASLPHARVRSREQGAGSREIGNTVVEIGERSRPVSVERQVFDFWATERHKRRDARYSDARRNVVRAALRAGYTTDDMFDAVRGVALDPWPDRPAHDDLVVVLRLGGRGNRNNLEHFRDLWRAGPQPARTGTSAQRQIDQARRTYEEMMADAAHGMGTDHRPHQRELARPAGRQTNR